MKVQVSLLLVFLFALLGSVFAVNYKGQVYIKHTGLDNEGDYVEVRTELIFDAQRPITRRDYRNVPENNLYGRYGLKVLDQFFPVSGDLNVVKLTVVEEDDATEDKICNMEIDADDIHRGINRFTCRNIQGKSDWWVRLKIYRF